MATRNTARNAAVESAIEQMQQPVPGSPEWRLAISRLADAAPIDDADDSIPIEETAADRVMRMIGATSADDKAVVKVFKVIGANKFAWCDDYSPADFEAGGLGMLRRKWGIAEFQIRVYGIHPENGKFLIRAKENITIAESTEPSSAAVPSELSRVLETMVAQQAQMLQAITQRPEAPDPMSQMQQMLAMMTAMRGAMGLDAQPKQTSNISDALAIVRELREASSELNPSDDPMARMLPMVGDIVKLATQQRGAPQPVEFPTVALPPAVAAPPVSLPKPSPSFEPEAEPMNITALRMQLSILIDMADKVTPPADAAEYVYEKATDEMLGMMTYPGWLDLLVKFEPKVEPHRAWFENTAAIVAQIDAEESNRGDEGEGGPETKPAVHAIGDQS